MIRGSGSGARRQGPGPGAASTSQIAAGRAGNFVRGGPAKPRALHWTLTIPLPLNLTVHQLEEKGCLLKRTC